ncbi:MAG: bifunctional [glutamate--ammonia ligase]-adenylyl-L-tyrosine phosphorylase/[glutamate--ammonia-ligase] adenylyltransferase [Chlamydiota bacterium]|nr:bifunctional [glutamate--ammonia ligase]-adenylyl-L-tyrosine phosphorylase/[glutamate--ammonia-ligase] adenylyltransferase [Chlamydiota bacterium]
MKNIDNHISDLITALKITTSWKDSITEFLESFPQFIEARSVNNLTCLLEDEISRDDFLTLMKPLLEKLVLSSDPDQGLNNFERFTRVYSSRSFLYKHLSAYSFLLDALITVFTTSQALSDILIRSPEYFDWLSDPDSGVFQKEKPGVLEEISQSFSHDYTEEVFIKSLHRYKSRMMLYIGIRDFLGLDAFIHTVSLISQLADYCLNLVFERARHELIHKFGCPVERATQDQEALFTIIGLGKLGGNELNYSSDIDIIFVYSEDGQTSGKSGALRKGDGVIENRLFFTKLSERILQIFSHLALGRALFRVDTRLRPDGANGPLVQSLVNYELYYSSLGRSWERQAFIKSRVIAGSDELGKRFLQILAPFIYRKYVDYKALDDLQRIKKRIETEIQIKGQTDTHVKLGTGGIREIEFSIQMLQLLYGGKIKSLRNSNTLEGIHMLQNVQLISHDEASELEQAYIFLRRVEHLLQLEEERQTHVLPTDEKRLQILAERMGYHDHSSVVFQTALDQHRKNVQKFFKKVFVQWSDMDDSERFLWVRQLDEEPRLIEDIKQRFVSYGIKDFEHALQNLRILGRSDEELPQTSDIRNVFWDLLPRILKSLYSAWNPDAALAGLPQFIDRYHARKTFYEMMCRYNHVVDLLISLFGSGQYLSTRLICNPYYFDALIGEGYLIRDDATPIQLNQLMNAPLDRWKKQALFYQGLELLKIALRDVVKMDEIEKTEMLLTELAEKMIREGCERLKIEFDPFPPLIVLGLGKLGSYELSYNSDLDMLFVCDGSPEEVYLAEKFVKRFIDLVGSTLYQIDLRLRPYGDQGSMVPSMQQCLQYYSRRTDLWERMAMSRTRLIWGDSALGKRFLESADEFIYGKPVAGESIRDVLHLRDRIKKERLSGQDQIFHLKASDGSLMDIEFLVQILSIKFLSSNRQNFPKHTLGILSDLAAGGIIDAIELEALKEAYLFYREVEGIIRLLTNTVSDTINTDDPMILWVQRAVGLHANVKVFTNYLEQCSQEVHRIFQQKLQALL